MFVKVCLLIALATIAMSAPSDSEAPKKALTVENHWANFKINHKKHYETPEEEAKRFEIFKDNWERIEAHNKKYEAGEVTYKQGINDFADLTHEEFSETHLMHSQKNVKKGSKHGAAAVGIH